MKTEYVPRKLADREQPFCPREFLVLKKTLQLCCRSVEPSPALGSWIIEAQWAGTNFSELVFEISGGVSGKLSLRSFAFVLPR